MIKECKKHGNVEHRAEKNRNKTRYRCKFCAVESNTRKRAKTKEMAVALKGGKCEKCGYDKCIDALEFHHPDPSKKEFALSQSQSVARAKLLKEAEQCILLCANCHREEHARLNRVEVSG